MINYDDWLKITVLGILTWIALGRLMVTYEKKEAEIIDFSKYRKPKTRRLPKP